MSQSTASAGSVGLRNSAWFWPLAVFVLLTAGVLAVYWPTWLSMFQVWNTPTYSHGYVVPLASAWLIWRLRAELAATTLRRGWLALILLLGAGLTWLLGELAGVNTPRHFAVIAMIATLIPLVFGWSAARKLTFPILFLFFAVPFGEFLVPVMMDWTANITIAMVSAVGVPIYREGLSFILPTGSWQVIEECSGQRYLIAAMPLACIFAYLNFDRNSTRVLFLLFTTAVALVANWLRAFGIVMLGHLSGMTIATGVDHLVYGWLFFGVVMALVFWVGSRWDEQPLPAAPVNDQPRARSLAQGNVFLSLIAGLACITVWTALSTYLYNRPGESLNLAQTLGRLGSLEKAPPLQALGLPAPFAGASTQALLRSPEQGASSWVGVFEQQRSGSEMISHGQGVATGRNTGWVISSKRAANAKGKPSIVATEYELSRGAEKLLIWESFVVAGTPASSKTNVKLLTAWQILRGGGDRTYVVLSYKSGGSDLEADRESLHSTMSAVQHAILHPKAQ